MLLDYATQEKRQPQEGVQVAGLLDLAKLLEYIGNPATQKTMSTVKGGIRAAPEQFYRDQGIFNDPRGRVMKDTGPTYQGRELPVSPTLRGVVENGTTLRDYLQGTEIGDVFAKDLQNVMVGATDLPAGYQAGYTAPQTVKLSDGNERLLQPGFLVVNQNAPPGTVGGLFEHEMQHAFQNILGMPRGTNLDEMSNDMVDYLIQSGQMRPAQAARIDAAAAKQGASKPYMRYASTTGEAEARAAEARYNAMAQGYDVGMPREAEYIWTHEGPQLSRNMLFDIPQNAQEGFNAWWRNRWK